MESFRYWLGSALESIMPATTLVGRTKVSTAVGGKREASEAQARTGSEELGRLATLLLFSSGWREWGSSALVLQDIDTAINANSIAVRSLPDGQGIDLILDIRSVAERRRRGRSRGNPARGDPAVAPCGDRG